MHRAFILSPVLLLLACGGDDKTTDGASDGSTGAASTGATSSDTTGSDATGTASATSPTTTEEGTSTSTGGDSSGATTGGAMYCQGWEDVAVPAYLDLFNKNMEPLTNGATLPLECGGQGIFMFGLYPKFGGFTPDGDLLNFGIVVDVDGFNNNPDGHFYSTDPVSYYVGCEPILGGVSGVLPVFPLDELANLPDLDGKPAKVQVVMHAPGKDVTVDVDVVLSAVKDDSWTFCGG